MTRARELLDAFLCLLALLAIGVGLFLYAAAALNVVGLVAIGVMP